MAEIIWHEEPLDEAPVDTELTHKIAVGAYIISDGKVLLLLRKNPPQVWAPPGGHLHKDENAILGLYREIKEECGFEVESLGPVAIGQGLHNGVTILAIFFLCTLKGGKFTLSDEHSGAKWYSRQEIFDNLANKDSILGEAATYRRIFLLFDLMLRQ